MDCELGDGEILTPEEIHQLAQQLWEQAGDPQEHLAAEIDRSQAAISNALRGEESKTRYVKICIDVITYYCEDVQEIHYPRGKVETSS